MLQETFSTQKRLPLFIKISCARVTFFPSSGVMSGQSRLHSLIRDDVNPSHPHKHMGTIEIPSAYKSLIDDDILNSSSCQQGSCLKKALTVNN